MGKLNKLEKQIQKEFEYLITDDQGYGQAVSDNAAKVIARFVKRKVKQAFEAARENYMDDDGNYLNENMYVHTDFNNYYKTTYGTIKKSKK